MREIKFRAWDESDEFSNGPSGMSYGVQHDCDATAIMQFTGLLDCNGQEIYEGDILQQYTHLQGMQVVWHDGKFVLRGSYDGDIAFYAAHCSIIGNIWEHPELLEAPK